MIDQVKTELLKVSQVMGLVPMSKPSIYRLMAMGKFPKPITLGERSVFWIKSDIEEYIQYGIDKRKENVA
jgi:prophage regulatory protein